MEEKIHSLGQESVTETWSALLSLPCPGHAAGFLWASQFGAGTKKARLGRPRVGGQEHAARRHTPESKVSVSHWGGRQSLTRSVSWDYGEAPSTHHLTHGRNSQSPVVAFEGKDRAQPRLAKKETIIAHRTGI